MKKTYYEFSQNNSGGNWDEQLPKNLYIEADSKQDALEKAFKLGVYFDGVHVGIDCGCCGDRWDTPSEVSFPYLYTSFERTEAEEIAKKFNATVKETGHFKGYGVLFENIGDYMDFQQERWGKSYGGIEFQRLVENDDKK